MALYRDYYEIELYANNRLIDLIPNSYGFEMTDSIHKIFSSGAFFLNDETGLLQEYLGTDQGLHVTLDYGTKDKTNRNKYIVLNNTLNAPSTSRYLSGEVEVPIKHRWFNYQERRSASFDDRISEVVKTLAQAYPFSGMDIEDTQNRDFWYQGNRTQAEFIKDILLPRAFSTNSGGTPFFVYITNDDVLHMRHLQSMYTQKAKAKYLYDMNKTHKKGDINQRFLIQSLMKWQADWDNETKKTRQYDIYTVNQDGSVEKQSTERLLDHIGGGRAVPIQNDQGNTTGIATWFFQEPSDDNDKGKINNLFRKNLFIDRFLITVPLNPYLQSGDKIEVEFNKKEESGVSTSERYSGNYIVEMCTHRWIKEENRGETEMVIGRGATTIPNEYIFEANVMKE